MKWIKVEKASDKKSIDALSILTMFERGIPNDNKDGQRISTNLTYSFLNMNYENNYITIF